MLAVETQEGPPLDDARTTTRQIPDRDQFGRALMDAHPKLTAHAVGLTRSPAQAEDLVQDTLEKALRNRDRFRWGTNLMAWLCTIQRNMFYSQYRKRSRRGIQVDIADQEAELRVGAAQDHDMELKDLARFYGRLPAQEQDTLRLIGLEGLSYAEAADRLDVEVGTVKSRTSRARRRLTGWLDRDMA